MNPLEMPIAYYKKEGISSYSIAYTGALAAVVGGLVNIVPAFRSGSMKCVLVDVGMVAGGLFAATVFLSKAGLMGDY
jgi:hypothetical protein|tara:strand:- start:448 stop:678 length:231 start_codon:yes stop_codon:yes gene_type:complete